MRNEKCQLNFFDWLMFGLFCFHIHIYRSNLAKIFYSFKVRLSFLARESTDEGRLIYLLCNPSPYNFFFNYSLTQQVALNTSEIYHSGELSVCCFYQYIEAYCIYWFSQAYSTKFWMQKLKLQIDQTKRQYRSKQGDCVLVIVFSNYSWDTKFHSLFGSLYKVEILITYLVVFGKEKMPGLSDDTQLSSNSNLKLV